MVNYVKSINGYAGNPALVDDKKIVLDSADIRVTGSSGDTIKAKVQSLASTMKTLELEPKTPKGDYTLRIGSYRMTF